MEQDFSERLKKYRREKNLTQQELADLLQVSNKTVSRWESGGGYPDVPMLVPLARALGVLSLIHISPRIATNVLFILPKTAPPDKAQLRQSFSFYRCQTGQFVV